MKIAIVCFFFNPDSAIGAVRPENWATWLAEKHEVTVITRENTIATDGDFSFKVVRPRSLLIQLIDWFQKKRVLRRISLANQAKLLKKSTGTKKRLRTGAIFQRMPCLYDFWAVAAFRELRRTSPDLVIATHSPYVNLIIAYLYSILFKKRLLWIDFRDLWTKNHTTTGLPLIRLLEQHLEKIILARADVITTVSKGLCKKINAEPKSNRVQLIYNSPLHSSVNRNPTSSNPEAVTFCYTGNVYGWQDPSPLFRLLESLHAEQKINSTSVRFKFASRLPGHFISLAKHFGISSYIDFLGAVSRSTALELQANSDILVLMEDPNDNADGVLTGKSFEYLATNRPVLLLGPGKESELYELINNQNRLITLSECKQFLEGSLSLLDGKPIDYCSVARNQLFGTLSSLSIKEDSNAK